MMKIKMMKLLTALVLCVSALMLQAFTPEMGGCRIKYDEAQSSYWIFGDTPERLVGSIGVVPQKDAGLVKVSIQDNQLVVDSREFYGAGIAGRSVTIRFYGINCANIVRLQEGKAGSDQNNRLSFDMKAEPAGVEAHLFLEGGTLSKEGKTEHYWQAEKFMFSGAAQKASIDRVLPANLKDLWARFDIRNPGVFSFRGVTLTQEESKQAHFDPSFNHIRNGGAERGWDSTMSAALKTKQMSHSGKHIDWRGIELSSEGIYKIDDSTAHSGRHSFLLESPEAGASFEFRFNPVPYFPGKPLSYTAWVKAEKPGTPVDMGLFICNGAATGQTFIVGTDWKKCEVYIPAWGEKDNKSVYVIGDMLNSAGKDSGCVSPGISLKGQKGKIWVDDVSCSVGGHSEFKDESVVWVRGELDHNRQTYFSGEPVLASLEFENASAVKVSAELLYEIKNFYGKTIFTSETVKKFDLAPSAIIKDNIKVELPAELRGPFELKFMVRSDSGKTDYKRFFMGVIDPKPEKLSKRVALEIPSEQNIRLIIPYLTDFGIGACRIGGASGNQARAFELTPYLKDAGISVLFCTGLSHAERDSQEKWDAYFKQLGELMARFKGNVEAYESQNEANIDGWNIESNLKQIKDLYAVVKANDPDAKIAGPTPCGTDFTWIDNVLRNGGAQYLDIVTEHPYRTLPELPDYADDAKAVRRIIDMYKPGMPHYGTEAGRVEMPQLPDAEINDYTRKAAARDVRNIIQAWCGGVARYHHFAIDMWNPGTNWNVIFQGNPGNNSTPVPAPVLYGIRNMIDRIGDAPAPEKVKLGLNYRCYIFDHSGSRSFIEKLLGASKRTAVLWKWQGAENVLSFNKEDAARLSAFDFFGTKIPADKLVLGEYPVYLDSSLSAEDLESLLLRGKLGSDDGHCISIEPVFTGSNKFAVNVRNLTGQPLNCILTVETPDIVIGEKVRKLDAIQPESLMPAEFTTAQEINASDRKIKFKVEVPELKQTEYLETNLRAILAHKVESPLAINGDLSDWPASVKPIILTSKNAAGKAPAWTPADDNVTAELRYAWSNDYLYVAVSVFKPSLYPLTNAAEPEAIWKYDGIQICFDTLRNADAGLTQFQDDDFEYSMGLLNDKPLVYRRWASSAVHDSLPKAQGVINEVPFAVKKYQDKVVYEAAFPRRAVSPFKLKTGSTMRTSIIINMNNGKERIGFLELTPGIGQQPKRPGLWMDIVLLP